ncbi:MAG: carboxypeptidase-like regulatory domain-containing protein [Planctomycetota bacterium]
MNRDLLLLSILLVVLLLGGLAGVLITGGGDGEAPLREDGALELEEDAPREPEAARRTAPVARVPDAGPATAPPVEAGGVDEPDSDPGLAALEGVVTAPGGEPVAGALVCLRRDLSAFEGAGLPGAVLGSAVTDDLGRYRMVDLEPEEWLLVTAEHPDFARKEVGGLSVLAGESLRRDLTLVPGTGISGVVRDESGLPVAGAIVRVAPQEAFQLDPTTGEEGRTETGSDGTFRVDHLMPGYKRVWAAAPGRETAVLVQVLVKRDQETEGVAFRLGAGRVIRGRVEDADGRPVADVTVNASRIREERQSGPVVPYPGVTTDRNGAFLIEGLPDGAYTLSARKPGYSNRGAFAHARTGSADAVIKVTRSPRIIGRVVDARTGEPVERFDLVASATPDLLFDGRPTAQSFRDPRGRFEFSIGERTGRVWLVARARGYAGGRGGPVLIGDARAGELVIEMERGIVVTGRVLDAEGRPVAGATARLEAHRASGEGSESRLAETLYGKMKRRQATARSDADGRYRIRAVMSGTYRLAVEADGFAAFLDEAALVVERDRDLDAGTCRLVRPARMRGRVIDRGDGGPAPREVVLRPLEGAPGRVYRSSVGKGGAYRIEGIHPGRYAIEVTRMAFRFENGETELPRVALDSGQDLQLDL